jgi:hypothetical protein
MIESNLKTALKEVEKFEKSAFWGYFKNQMDMNQEVLKARLRVCDLEQVETTRAKIDCNELLISIPNKMKDHLRDEIELQKDAKKVEAARQPAKYSGQTKK